MSRSILRNASLLSAVALSLLASACAGTEDEEPMPSSEEIAQDEQYMQQAFEKRGSREAMQIDLADDKQFKYLRNKLRVHGIDKLSAPEVHEQLGLARERAIAAKLQRSPGGIDYNPLNAGEGTEDPRCSTEIYVDELDADNFKTVMQSGCIEGFNYDAMIMEHFAGTQKVLEVAAESWVDGNLHEEAVTPQPAMDKEMSAKVTMLATTPAGTTEAFYLQTPPMVNHQLNTPVRINMDHPLDQDWNGQILVCLERSTNSPTCDYKHTTSGTCAGNALCDRANDPKFPVYPATYNTNRLYLPMKGSSVGAAANGMVIDKIRSWATLDTPDGDGSKGGFCKGDLTGSPFFSLQAYTSYTAGVRIALHAPALGTGTWANHCVKNRQKVDMHLEVTTKNPVTGAAGPTFTWSSQKNAQNVAIYWGCMPPGTEIKLVGGATTKIEDIAIGQKVMADESGRMLTVVDVVEGTERKPLVRIIDSVGNTVNLTDTHPVPVVGGDVREARELAIGDRIMTEDGVTTVAYVEKEDYEGVVYNLVLGTPEEREGLAPTKTTMYANGVLVGDSQMQSFVRLRADALAESKRLEALPESYRLDYQRSLERQRAREAAKR